MDLRNVQQRNQQSAASLGQINAGKVSDYCFASISSYGPRCSWLNYGCVREPETLQRVIKTFRKNRPQGLSAQKPSLREQSNPLSSKAPALVTHIQIKLENNPLGTSMLSLYNPSTHLQAHPIIPIKKQIRANHR